MDTAKNFAKGTLSTGYDDLATSIVVGAGQGARFPAVPFNAVWWDATDFPDPSDDPAVEIVRVTARSVDTLTVVRGQEGTTAQTHEQDNKVYRLIAPLTAKSINENILPATMVADDWTVTSLGSLQIDTSGAIVLNAVDHFRASPSAAGVVVELIGGLASMGDVDGNNSGAQIAIDDNTGRIKLQGVLCTDQSVAGTTLGSVTKKLQIFTLAGVSLGFIPIYDSIT